MAYTLGDIGNAPGQVYDFLKRKFVSLTTPDEEGDYSSRKGGISRQQKLAEALSQMGAQEEEVSTVGGITAPVSGMGALARGLTSFGGSYLSGKTAADEAALKKSSRDEAIAANKRYYELKPELAVSEEAPAPSLTQMKFDMPSLRAATGNLEMPSPNGTTNIDMGFNMPKMPGEYNQQTTANLLLPGVNRAELKMKGLNREEKNKLLDEFAMSDNPYLVSLSERIAAKEKPEFVPGDKEGIYRRVGDELVNVVKPRPDAADVPAASTLSKLQNERARLIDGGANASDPLVRQYDAAINLETTRAPGVNVNVGAEKPFAKALGTGAADVLEASSNAARGGVRSLGTIAQMRNALKTGKVNLGPGASVTQLWQQMTGGDPARINNTRSITQGLAQLTLNARGSLKGQGTITDREQELLEKAVSATSIDSLTISELNEILAVAERAANFSINENEVNVNRARNIPGASEVIDFYSVSRPKSFDDILNQYPGKPNG